MRLPNEMWPKLSADSPSSEEVRLLSFHHLDGGSTTGSLCSTRTPLLEAYSGWGALNPAQWPELPPQGRALLSTNLRLWYADVSEAGGQTGHESQHLLRLLDTVVSNASHEDEVLEEMAKSIIARLEVLKTGVSEGWGPARALSDSYFKEREVPEWLRPHFQHKERAKKNSNKTSNNSSSNNAPQQTPRNQRRSKRANGGGQRS